MTVTRADVSLQFFLILFWCKCLSFQGFRFCRQEAGQLGGERLPPVCRVGPRTARLGHRQLHQQGHAVAATVEGAGETAASWLLGSHRRAALIDSAGRNLTEGTTLCLELLLAIVFLETEGRKTTFGRQNY